MGYLFCNMPLSTLLLFTKGQSVFAFIFIICFAAYIIWAYKADAKINAIHYKNVWLVITGVIVIAFSIIFLSKILH